MSCNDRVIVIYQDWVSPAELFYAGCYLRYLCIAVRAAVGGVWN
jgi:hypothetical protein